VSDVVFADRADAGRRLGHHLAGGAFAGDLVLGIPRGGVVVAAAVAVALRLPLGVAVARKIGAPRQPELALGAVGPNGDAFVDELLAARVGASAGYVTDAVDEQRRLVRERVAALPAAFRDPDVRGRSVIVVDDGMATGATAMAIGIWLRGAGARYRLLALPVAATDATERLRLTYEEVVVLTTPPGLFAVGQAYLDFTQTSDDEIARLLAAAAPA
jgi:putative phosphoribosyl transferase